MPIYEFYCSQCHTIYNFFSQRIDTTTVPKCPRCKEFDLSRRMSMFAVTGKAKEDGDLDDLPFDESKMEKAMESLASQADGLDENDPRQAANLMRQLTDMTGMELGPGMQEALQRMEKGEDPEAIESELGDLLESEDPFILPGKTGGGVARQVAPRKDDTLYDLHSEA